MSKETNLKEATTLITNAEARTCTFSKTFTIGEESHTGAFTFKYPSLIERSQIGVARAKMLDGAKEESLDRFTSDVTFMFAYLDKLMVSCPSWFRLGEIEEYAILDDLYKEVSNWVANFRQSNGSNKYERHSITTSDEETMESN